MAESGEKRAGSWIPPPGEAAVYAVEDEAEAADMDTATPAEIANYYESG